MFIHSISIWERDRINITELNNGRRELAATSAKCNLHKWHTLYAY